MPPALVATRPPTVAVSRAARSTPKSSPAARAWRLQRRQPYAGASRDLAGRESSGLERGEPGQAEHDFAAGRHPAADEPGIAALDDHLRAGFSAQARRTCGDLLGGGGPDDAGRRPRRNGRSSRSRTSG